MKSWEHIEKEIKQEPQVFNCEKCEIKFSGLGILKEHIRKGNSENVKKKNFVEILRIHKWHFHSIMNQQFGQYQ